MYHRLRPPLCGVMATENSHRLAYAGPRHPEHGFPMWFEDEAGARFWIFRAGDGEHPDTGNHRWFLHGIFG